MSRSTLLGALVAAPALLASSSAFAEQASAMTDVVYDLYVGGIHLARAEGRVGVTEDLYGLRLDAGLVGLTARLVRWSAMVEGNGRVIAAGAEPRRFVMENEIRRDFRTIRMSFGDGTLTELEMLPELRPEVERVPEELLVGAYDPLGAMVAVLSKVTDAGTCTASLPVFDGRRLYTLHVEDAGIEQLTPNRYTDYVGQARRCSVTFEPVAGDFNERTRELIDRMDRPPAEREINVWISQPVAGGPYLPVRASAHSGQHGAAVVHIRHAALGSDTPEERAELFGPVAAD